MTPRLTASSFPMLRWQPAKAMQTSTGRRLLTLLIIPVVPGLGTRGWGLAIAACRQRKRGRFTTAAQLVNELTEAKNRSELNRVTNRWMRYELIVIDELAYVAMPEAAAELLFQIIAGRAERAAVIATTNLPFSEWTTMFPNARLCKAMLDRLTDQAHIIETGNESYRFRRTLKKKSGSK